MRRGTTPKLTFAIPFHTSLVARGKVVFKQGDKIKLQKAIDECFCFENVISVSLTQEDTFLFNTEERLKVQLRIVTTDDKALASEVYACIVTECLDDEVV